MSLPLNILHCALLAVFLSCCTPHADAEPAVENSVKIQIRANNQEVDLGFCEVL